MADPDSHHDLFPVNLFEYLVFSSAGRVAPGGGDLMPDFKKYVLPPGEDVHLLAFSADLKNVIILDGYKKEGALAINGIDQRGFDLSNCDSMIYRNQKGKPIGMIYPVIYDIATGVRFMGIGKNQPAPIESPTAMLAYIKAGLSKETKIVSVKTPVQLKADPVILQLTADPRLHGKALDSALLKNALSLKGEFWQLVVCLLVGLIFGIVIF